MEREWLHLFTIFFFTPSSLSRHRFLSLSHGIFIPWFSMFTRVSTLLLLHKLLLYLSNPLARANSLRGLEINAANLPGLWVIFLKLFNFALKVLECDSNKCRHVKPHWQQEKLSHPITVIFAVGFKNASPLHPDLLFCHTIPKVSMFTCTSALDTFTRRRRLKDSGP